MYDHGSATTATVPQVEFDVIAQFRQALIEGTDWVDAILDSLSVWSVPEETVDDKLHRYFIGGEAFDWLLLSQRLYESASDLLNDREVDDLLFNGMLPERIDADTFRERLGVQKFRGFLNYFYGVTVEEALHAAVEKEVHKRHIGNGVQYRDDFSDESFQKIYHEPKESLFEQFQIECNYFDEDSLTVTQSKEFTYWLFKYRMRTADKAKIASDTRKGLEQLKQMMRERTSIYPLT